MKTAPTEFRDQVPEGALELRSVPTDETRAESSDGAMRVTGLGSVYNVRETLGFYWQWDEEVMPGAWSNTISREGADIRSMFNHNTDRLLGRTTAGTLRLLDSADGLIYDVDINAADPLAVSVFEQVDRGDVTGASVWFRVIREQWTEPTEENGLERPLRQILEAELFEVGPVVFPAFPDTTAAAARSIDNVLRGAGVKKPAKRAALTVEILTNPAEAESRIAELVARSRQPDPPAAEDRDQPQPAPDPVDQPSPRQHHTRTLQLLEKKYVN